MNRVRRKSLLESPAELGVRVSQKVQGPIPNALQGFPGALTPEWQMPQQGLKSRHREGPIIGLWRRRFTPEQLRCRVGGGPDESTQLREPARVAGDQARRRATPPATLRTMAGDDLQMRVVAVASRPAVVPALSAAVRDTPGHILRFLAPIGPHACSSYARNESWCLARISVPRRSEC